MIRNIVFDMGNVIIEFNPEAFIKRAGITDSKDAQIVRTELFSSVEWAMMDMGIETEDSFEPKVMARIPDRLKRQVHELLRNWAFPRKMIPGMENLVRKLKEAGYPVYLLSNASVGQPDYWNRIPVSKYFDGTMISAFVKTIKPCPAIYRLFTEEFGLREEECLFIDDTPMNVAGAIACGWDGIVFHGDSARLEQEMKEKGIRL